jgi:hypothetical protein
LNLRTASTRHEKMGSGGRDFGPARPRTVQASRLGS